MQRGILVIIGVTTSGLVNGLGGLILGGIIGFLLEAMRKNKIIL